MCTNEPRLVITRGGRSLPNRSDSAADPVDHSAVDCEGVDASRRWIIIEGSDTCQFVSVARNASNLGVTRHAYHAKWRSLIC